MAKARWAGIATAALLSIAGHAAEAQQVQRIAAIVNDDVISMFDLNARMRMIIVTSDLNDSPETRSRIAPQILRSLIDERLQMQEAKRRNVSVTDREMKRAVSSIETRNNVSSGGLDKFLGRSGIEVQTVKAQIRAGIAWSKLIGRRLRPRISIGEEEVEEVLVRLKTNRGKTEYRLAEIFLAIDTPDDETRVHGIANRMVRQIRGGARFGVLAKQFSQNATAAVSGDLGWIAESELDKELRTAVSKLKQGEIAAPVRTPAGLRIIRLSASRKIAGADPSLIRIGLKQVLLPFPKSPSSRDVEAQIDLAKTVRSSISGCRDMAVMSKEVGSPVPADLGKFALTDLSPGIRNAISGLKIGEASPPVRMPNGFLLLMVCERDEPKYRLPKREDIVNQLTRRRLDMMARRYLRDIRRAAIVDVRV